MKYYFRILLAVLAHFGFATLTASAHAGSGIIVDAQGRVYFSEAGDIDARLPGAVWQIDQQGKLTRLHEGRQRDRAFQERTAGTFGRFHL